MHFRETDRNPGDDRYPGEARYGEGIEFSTLGLIRVFTAFPQKVYIHDFVVSWPTISNQLMIRMTRVILPCQVGGEGEDDTTIGRECNLFCYLSAVSNTENIRDKVFSPLFFSETLFFFPWSTAGGA